MRVAEDPVAVVAAEKNLPTGMAFVRNFDGSVVSYSTWTAVAFEDSQGNSIPKPGREWWPVWAQAEGRTSHRYWVDNGELEPLTSYI
jgi:hypothetical protein